MVGVIGEHARLYRRRGVQMNYQNVLSNTYIKLHFIDNITSYEFQNIHICNFSSLLLGIEAY